MKIGFIGQGFIGKNYADEFERRGYETVRYSLEEEYIENKDSIVVCDVVFVAVPTPTTEEGFDFSIVEESLSLVGDKKIVVIKSTIIPGITSKLQTIYPNITVLFSPEFLSKATAAHDAEHPICNVIGILSKNEKYTTAAEKVMSLLPKSKHNYVVSAEAAELFKYTHNVHGYIRIVFANMLYDVAEKLNINWSEMESMMDTDPMMSAYYNTPVHSGGRGAGGCCFIKDMAAFRSFYEDLLQNDLVGIDVLESLEKKNLLLLSESNKNQDIIKEVYGSVV